jgi:hypothetical protein
VGDDGPGEREHADQGPNHELANDDHRVDLQESPVR